MGQYILDLSKFSCSIKSSPNMTIYLFLKKKIKCSMALASMAESNILSLLDWSFAETRNLRRCNL